MKKIKKIIPLLIVILLSLAVMASCSVSNEEIGIIYIKLSINPTYATNFEKFELLHLNGYLENGIINDSGKEDVFYLPNSGGNYIEEVKLTPGCTYTIEKVVEYATDEERHQDPHYVLLYGSNYYNLIVKKGSRTRTYKLIREKEKNDYPKEMRDIRNYEDLLAINNELDVAHTYRIAATNIIIPPNFPGIGTKEQPFIGKFYGAGMSLVYEDRFANPIFNYVGGDALIQDVSLRQIVNDPIYMPRTFNTQSLFVGHMESGTLYRCMNYVDVHGESVAGFVGTTGFNPEDEPVIKACINFGNMTGSDRAFGICGTSATALVDGCVNMGKIQAAEAAGISGGTNKITKSYNSGEVIGDFAAAGISLDECGELSYCANYSDVRALDEEEGVAGGICAYVGETDFVRNLNYGKISAKKANPLFPKTQSIQRTLGSMLPTDRKFVY